MPDARPNEVLELASSQHYAEALAALRRAPERWPPAAYHYNGGTLHYHLHQPALAVAHLEKAARLAPHDPDIHANLRQARAAFERTEPGIVLDPASHAWERIADRVPLEEIRACLGLTLLLSLLFWTRTFWKTRRLRTALAHRLGILGAGGFLITAMLYGIERWSASHPPAICLEDLSIRSGPGRHYMELGRAQAGTKVRLYDAQATEGTETWRQIRFTTQEIGWFPVRALLFL